MDDYKYSWTFVTLFILSRLKLVKICSIRSEDNIQINTSIYLKIQSELNTMIVLLVITTLIMLHDFIYIWYHSLALHVVIAKYTGMKYFEKP